MDTEDKLAYCRAALAVERDFVDHRLPELGLSGMINPEKEHNKYAPDLVVDGELADLKSQCTPFFKAGAIYGVDPQYAVSFNLKDEQRYAENYPHLVVFFDVHWTTTSMSIGGEVFRVQPLRATYAGYLADVLAAALDSGGHRHDYQRRRNDTAGNARNSWVLDVRRLVLLG